MKTKRITAILLAMIILFTIGMTTYAKESQEDVTDGYVVKEIADKYGITENEVLHLTENVTNALQEASAVQGINKNGYLIKEIPVSDNLVMVLTTSEESFSEAAVTRAAGKRYTVTATLELKNVLGMTVVTLKSVGVFESDFTICTPVDAYGTYEASVWNVTNISSSLGGPQYNAYARNSFSGELNIGIDPVSMTIESFGYACTLHCNAVGNYSADWS